MTRPGPLNGGNATIASLHATYCRMLPSHAVSLNMAREFEWSQWLRWRRDAPFTAQDLSDVIRYRRALICEGRQFEACLKFHHLVGQPDLFEEDLAQARTQRARFTGDRGAVLRATGRPDRQIPEARPASDHVPAALAKLRAAIQ